MDFVFGLFTIAVFGLVFGLLLRIKTRDFCSKALLRTHIILLHTNRKSRGPYACDTTAEHNVNIGSVESGHERSVTGFFFMGYIFFFLLKDSFLDSPNPPCVL